MTPASDPYRTLGLARGASLDEVRRAYRTLAKANHPDAAGASALPRFLAIQAAYEQLVGGAPPTTGRAAPTTGAATPPRPSAADPDRAGATHRAYGGRTRRARPTSPGSGRRPGPAAPGAGSGRDESIPDEPTSRGKATLGSTSYDGADAGPFEPDWGGASWYGTSSGTYWTINPKEYADPRKHGPEYQARARRTTTSWSATTDAIDATAAADAPGAPSATAAGPRATAAPRAASAPRTAASAPPIPPRPTTPEPPDLAAAATDLGRALTDERTARGRWRVVQVIVGWLPILFGIGWLVGEVTGCGRFAAACDPGAASVLTPVLALASLATLLLVPTLASFAATAAVVLVVVAVPTALVLSAGGDDVDVQARSTLLGFVLVIAWVAGLGIAIGRRIRGVSPPDDAPGPVS